MSNFDFLKDFDETLWKLGNRIEKQINISPSGVKSDATTFLEHILKGLLQSVGFKYNSRKGFYSQLDSVYRLNKITYGYKQKIYSAYKLRHHIHDNFDDIEKNEFFVALELHEKLFYIAKKYYRDFSDDYDSYKGVPSYNAPQIDTSDDELELIKIPDFNEIIDIEYDYCIICGEPNHSNYSIFCPKCNQILDNANNFISIRNNFGKNSQFTKEDLIEFGIPEGYANRLINSLVLENVLRVKGRFISFNNINFDEYMSKIDKYLSIGELLTRFIEDELTAQEIKQTNEYKSGSFKQFPYYQFYKIVNNEIINKFEKDLLSTSDIEKSVKFTTITQKQLNRWYGIERRNFEKNIKNDAFILFNQLLMDDYLDLKREGIPEKDIQKQLNIDSYIYEFWQKNFKEFINEISEIKKDLILQALSENKTKKEAIDYAGITLEEYEKIVEFSKFKGNSFSIEYANEVEERKENLLFYLETHDLVTSCKLAKISLNDFNKWYGESDFDSDFYKKSTNILMNKFLFERKKGKTKAEACDFIGIEEKIVDYWLKRKLDIFDEFKNKNLNVILELIYDGFKNKKHKKEIIKKADITVGALNRYLKLGKRGYGDYKKIYECYYENVIPKQLSMFLNEFQNKSMKKSLKIAELSEEELNNCCELAKNGDARFYEFYKKYMDIKLNLYLNSIKKGKDKSKSLRNANLTEEELNRCYELGKNGDELFSNFYNEYYDFKSYQYLSNVIDGKDKSSALVSAGLSEDELNDDADELILLNRIAIVTEAITNDLTTKQAARKANISEDTIYDWFLKGRDGDEIFEAFSNIYYDSYIHPGAFFVQKAIRDGISIKTILKKFKKQFTAKDYKFWEDNGFLKEAAEEFEDENNEIKDLTDLW